MSRNKNARTFFNRSEMLKCINKNTITMSVFLNEHLTKNELGMI